MAKQKKKIYLVGNWKMNPDTLEEAKAVFSASERAAKKARKVTVIVCPPALYLTVFSKKPKLSSRLGAQDVHAEVSGPHTGSISPVQIRNSGAEYAIIGHSERRAAGDTEEIVKKKVAAALSAGLSVILCVGEEARDPQGAYLAKVRQQIVSVFSSIEKKHYTDVMVAYEPVWAIGKSYADALSPDAIHEMSIFIKKAAAEVMGTSDALRLPVLYGGSVDFANAQKILADGEINGLLIGRQSLDAENFPKIIAYANAL